MSSKELAMLALQDLAELLPNGADVELRINVGNDKFIHHKFCIEEGRMSFHESQSDQFVESPAWKSLTGKSKIRWS